jgi:hypothetical protein
MDTELNAHTESQMGKEEIYCTPTTHPLKSLGNLQFLGTIHRTLHSLVIHQNDREIRFRYCLHRAQITLNFCTPLLFVSLSLSLPPEIDICSINNSSRKGE